MTETTLIVIGSVLVIAGFLALSGWCVYRAFQKDDHHAV